MKIKQKQFINSCYFSNKFTGEDVVMVKEKLRLEDDSIVPNIRLIKNPKRSFYITKPKFRNHKHKKSYELLEKLDKIVCYNSELGFKIKKALGDHANSNRLYTLLNNQYVYGADIPIEVLVKIQYEEENKDKPLIPLDIGYFDIEVSMMEKSYLDNNEIICLSFNHNETVYTGLLKHLMYHEDEKTKKMVPFTLEELKEKSERVIKEALDKSDKSFNFKYIYYIADSEEDLLKWTFKTINKNNTDFLAIWNMKFDIPHILKRLDALNIDRKKLICSEEIPDQYKNLVFLYDKTLTSHYSLKWDWFRVTSGTQFIDGLGLYSTLRKTSGFESSYTLDYILNKNINLGKLSLGKEESHRIMQSKHFLDYVIYNQFDIIGPYVMEMSNQDILQMYKRNGVNPIEKFGKMNFFLRNNFYYFFLKRNKIISSIGSGYKVPYENKFWSCECKNLTGFDNRDTLCEICETKVLSKFGGAVLQPSKCVGVGLNMKNNLSLTL